MRMIIVRHGESEWNRIHRYQGQLDAPLSALGVRQAHALAERLRHEQVAAFYTSPLQRCAHTLEIIAAFHEGVPIHRDEALMEIHHGDWQGKFADEVVAQYGEGLEEWRQHPMRSQMPNGESFSNVLRRTMAFKEQVLATHQHETKAVVVSTHDVVIKMLIADVLEMNMDCINRIWLTNGSVSMIDYREDMSYLATLSEWCHLGDMAVPYGGQKAL
ncbi:MAG: histidine phosphatase family protein [Chloroflexaceae bacterium]|nr:histidine phosphatase family protein [Chloroflexaceae bacterium]